MGGSVEYVVCPNSKVRSMGWNLGEVVKKKKKTISDPFEPTFHVIFAYFDYS